MQQAQSVHSLLYNNKAPKTDSVTLDNIGAKLTLTIKHLHAKGTNISISEHLELNTFTIGQLVLTAMQRNEVLLLPDLYRQFRDNALKQKSGVSNSYCK